MGVTIPEAKRLDVMAIAKVEGSIWTSRYLFQVEGQAGIWRKVSREGRQFFKVGAGNVLVIYDGAYYEMRRWTILEDMLFDLLSIESVDGGPV